MIRVAFVVDTIETPGAGLEKQLLLLLKHLNREEFEPVLVCLRQSDWMAKQTFSFAVEIIHLTSLLRPSFIRACGDFRRLHRRYKFDIVQVFTVDANYFGTIASRMAGVRSVVSSRRDTGYWQSPMTRVLLRINRWMTPHYLANSQAAARACAANEGVDPGRIEVIHNGLELDRYAPRTEEIRRKWRAKLNISESEIVIGCVANLRPVKNIESLVEAGASLCRTRSNLRFVVVGEGSSRSSLQQRIDEGGLHDRFHLVGACEDVVPWLSAFDCAVLCSKAESFSNSLVEYMAAGLPIVASAVGGAAEAIESGKSGILYDPESPGALTLALQRLLNDQVSWPELGASASQRAQDFSLRECVAKHEGLYRRLASRNKQHPVVDR